MSTATAIPTWRRVGGSRGFIAVRSFAIFFALWWAVFTWNANPLQLPSPLKVLQAVWGLIQGGELLEHAAISSGRLAIALVVAWLCAGRRCRCIDS